ncbi:hypothetical protein BRC86_14230 [Halobacteriales archaeon QS_3_64_16]|nr:MAG: hypothetical protein BRC86_14230 [Halobacteriales archaeon QS_3_64_16]
MSQSDDQKTQAMEKVSNLGEQLDVGGDDLSNAFDKLKNGDLQVQQLASLGETIGRQGGSLLGRQMGEAVGQKFADDDGTLSFSSIANTLRSSRAEEGDGEDGEEGAEGSAESEGASEDEESGDEGGNEAELEGDGSGSFEDMSDEELQNLANDLMDELDQRESSES